jgi:squalene-associated FAD-dependent desaturase
VNAVTQSQLLVPTRGQRPETVAIIGGGLAGLAAGCALSDAGFRVTLFEKRPYLGGRASSYEHPGTGEIVDNCQHVLLGCCTNLRDFYRRLGVEDKIRWYDRLTYIEPGGRTAILESGNLPAPFHSLRSFWKFPLLDSRDKFAIARAMMLIAESVPKETGEDFLTWLRHHGQTQRAIDRFWAPVLISALNEELDRVSYRYAAMVFRDSFLKSAEAGRMGVPTVPLTELYSVAADYIRARGGQVHLRSSVDAFQSETDHVRLNVGGEEQSFDYVVPAVPFNVLSRILPETLASDSLRDTLAQFGSSPITGIHLWFDREITELEHAVLLDRTIQWMFHKSRLLAGRAATPDAPLAAGSYIELVVSSSKTLVEKGKGEIIDLALRELAEFFPAVKEARVLKATVIKEIHATFSPAPGSDAYRPQAASAWPRVFLSGDWTATGWPATMEGAVRGGYSTAEALASAAGAPQKFLIPDLPARGLMRLLP